MEKIEWAIKWTTLQGRFYHYNYKYCYKELKEQKKKYPYLSNALLYTPKHYYEYYFSNFFITISKINETHNLFGFTLTAQLHHKCTFMAKINTQKKKHNTGPSKYLGGTADHFETQWQRYNLNFLKV